MSASASPYPSPSAASAVDHDDDGPTVTLIELLTWIGQGKRLIIAATLVAVLLAMLIGFLLPKTYTAQATLLAPDSQRQGGSAAALAALGSLGGLVAGGAGGKSPDELYVALLKSDSVDRALNARFDLEKRYGVANFEALRKVMPRYVHITADKKSGLISVDVDDGDPKFAAALANAHATEISKVLDRLAVSEAQLRRVFFEKQLNDSKENLIKAEQNLQTVQEASGVIMLDKQAEALIIGAAEVRAQISAREVQLKVLRTSATAQNPDVIRLSSELRALRSELTRMESTQGGAAGSAVDMPVGKLPEAGVGYVRARREMKLQEAMLEGMLRQYEAAKLDEAKEGPQLQQVDVAMPPDHKSKPSISLLMIGAMVAALLLSTVWVVIRRYGAWSREHFPEDAPSRAALARAWRWRAA